MLFRSLFRGRADVFPQRWENTRKGKAGYAPACGNEWKPGLCDKPRIKCGACSNQAFLAVTDEVIDGHLRGRHTVGIYPLVPDDTCWFLAADFDRRNWRAGCRGVSRSLPVEGGAGGPGTVAVG